MKKLTAEDTDTTSPDLVAGNIEQLKALFPEAFTEGRVDFDVLRQLLGGEVEDREEKYGLNWHGKRRARQLALTPSTGTLRPCPEESVDWDTTQNLMIEGDNLEVLKLLRKATRARSSSSTSTRRTTLARTSCIRTIFRTVSRITWNSPAR
jgi:adenine-specific DNA-methyltransferase